MSVPVRGRRRQEGGEKVTGATRFTADLELPGLLHVHLVVAHTPRARIRGIETAAARSAPGVVDVIKLGPVTVDFTRRVAIGPAGAILLTNREFEILQFLAERSNRTVCSWHQRRCR